MEWARKWMGECIRQTKDRVQLWRSNSFNNWSVLKRQELTTTRSPGIRRQRHGPRKQRKRRNSTKHRSIKTIAKQQQEQDDTVFTGHKVDNGSNTHEKDKRIMFYNQPECARDIERARQSRTTTCIVRFKQKRKSDDRQRTYKKDQQYNRGCEREAAKSTREREKGIHVSCWNCFYPIREHNRK